MSTKKPLIAILADLPLGRLLPEKFQNIDHATTYWLSAIFDDLQNQSDYKIHWITMKRYAKQYEHIEHGNQHIHIVPAPSLAIGLFTGHFIASRRLRKLLNQLKPALVHVWGIELPYAKACIPLNIPKILSYQGSLHEYEKEIKLGIFPTLQAIWERRTTPYYQIITCESEWCMQIVRELNKSAELFFIDYGIEQEFQNLKNNPASTPSCAFVGLIEERKGIPYIIEAFKNSKLSHIDLYLAGTGQLRSLYEPTSPSNIHWLGKLNRAELRELLKKSWCMIAPTLGDTGPTVVKEALCMGLPIITTTHAGCKQYIEEGKNGYIIPIKDSEAIKEAVLKLTESREKAIAMGQYKLEENRTALDVQLTSKKFLALYRHLLNGEIYPYI